MLTILQKGGNEVGGGLYELLIGLHVHGYPMRGYSTGIKLKLETLKKFNGSPLRKSKVKVNIY